MVGKGSRVIYEHAHFPGLDYIADYTPHAVTSAQMQVAQNIGLSNAMYQSMMQSNSQGASLGYGISDQVIAHERYGFGYLNYQTFGAGGGGGGGTSSVTVPSAHTVDSRMLPPPPAPITYPFVETQTRMAFYFFGLIILLGLLYAIFPHGWHSTGWF